jgi:hypothetical protein
MAVMKVVPLALGRAVFRHQTTLAILITGRSIPAPAAEGPNVLSHKQDSKTLQDILFFSKLTRLNEM